MNENYMRIFRNVKEIYCFFCSFVFHASVCHWFGVYDNSQFEAIRVLCDYEMRIFMHIFARKLENAKKAKIEKFQALSRIPLELTHISEFICELCSSNVHSLVSSSLWASLNMSISWGKYEEDFRHFLFHSSTPLKLKKLLRREKNLCHIHLHYAK